MTSLEKHVFVDVREGNIVSTEEKRLTLAHEGLIDIPRNLILDYAHLIEILDLSNNKIKQVGFLKEFSQLTTLILDHNFLDSEMEFPFIPSLRTLWLNHNQVESLYPFIPNIRRSFPNLTFLSLMGNPGCPSYLNGGTYYQYINYRLFVISFLPKLEYFDDKAVSVDQKNEANRLFRRSPLLALPNFVQERLQAFGFFPMDAQNEALGNHDVSLNQNESFFNPFNIFKKKKRNRVI